MTSSHSTAEAVGVWQQVEFEFVAQRSHSSPYTGVDVWVDFTAADDGATIRRPAFWDGGDAWKVRFAAPAPGRWTWVSSSSIRDPGLVGITGVLDAEAAP